MSDEHEIPVGGADSSPDEEELETLRLAEVREALDDLRREIEQRFGGGVRAPLGEIDWMALYDELRRRISTIGMVERSGEVDEFGLDDVVLQRLAPLLDFLLERYWRVDLSGLDALPASGPCLLVANRSGLLPYDGVMVSHALARHGPEAGRPRFLVADWLITLPFAQSTLARIGGVRASRENADRLLRRGHRVVAFPEGQKGAAKVFRDRYRLQRFGRGGVVRLALEREVPLVPVAIVGAEEAHPVLFKVGAPARALGLPFLPVTPTFPFLGPLGLLPLPSKWAIHIGEPLPLDGLGPEAAADELLVSRLNEELRQRIQTTLDATLRSRDSVWG